MEDNLPNNLVFTAQQLKDFGIQFDETRDSFEINFPGMNLSNLSQLDESAPVITNHIIPETQESELTQSLSE